MAKTQFALVGVLVIMIATTGSVGRLFARQTPAADVPDIRLFFQTMSRDGDLADEALEQLATVWKDSYAALIWDLMRFTRSPRLEPEHRSAISRQRLTRFLEKQTDKRFGDDLRRWQEWIWELPYQPHPGYGEFKGVWYGQVDPRMRDFFPPGVRSLIRLDEMDWGGVVVNGIPPLEHPTHVPADAADYLKDDHVVFGIALNGEARAYPKRILAWHEMALDRLGGVELTIVYCTLCGTVIPYESVVNGVHRTFGTSGLLYRSNKLMFDEETRSLWSTLEGKPVIGPLADRGLQLRYQSVVTTTWDEWKTKHPHTTVLSLETGYERDYSEGAAYRDYFSTDRLMFPVSSKDDRLKNKDEVVALLLPTESGEARPLAISAEFLRRRPVYHTEVAGHRLVVVTSREGANRVYNAGATRLSYHLGEERVADTSGRIWDITEDALVSEGDPAQRLGRVAAYRAFWFGWYAQFPDTELIK